MTFPINLLQSEKIVLLIPDLPVPRPHGNGIHGGLCPIHGPGGAIHESGKVVHTDKEKRQKSHKD